MAMQTNCIYQLGIYKSTTVVLKERCNVNHPVKKGSLHNTVQLATYLHHE